MGWSICWQRHPVAVLLQIGGGLSEAGSLMRFGVSSVVTGFGEALAI